jgi:hypothetical protein
MKYKTLSHNSSRHVIIKAETKAETSPAPETPNACLIPGARIDGSLFLVPRQTWLEAIRAVCIKRSRDVITRLLVKNSKLTSIFEVSVLMNLVSLQIPGIATTINCTQHDRQGQM